MAQDASVPPAAAHAASALVAIVLIAGAAAFAARGAGQTAPAMEPASAAIALEHAKPAGLDAALGAKGNGTLIDLSVRAEEAVILSVPESWQLHETRGVPLTSVVKLDAEGGYQRLRMPAGGASFIAPQPINRLEIHNPTAQPLRARVKSVDLTTGAEREDESIIMRDPVTLPLPDPPAAPSP